MNVKSTVDEGGEGHTMRIGELAALSRTPTRSLRYYEEQGLIHPDRLDNGYRDYGPELVDRAVQIRHLIDCGVPTRIIAVILPCLQDPQQIVPDDTSPELVAMLREERGRMDERIGAMTRNRDAIDRYIAGADHALARRRREVLADRGTVAVEGPT